MLFVALGGGVVLLIGLGFVVNAWSPRFLLNVTPSEPRGLYLLSRNPVAIGAIVAIPAPAVAAAAEGGPVTSVLKAVAAGGGDLVCIRSGRLAINGRDRAPVLDRTAKGALLPHWSGCRRLTPGELFLFSDRVPNSFDSRYFGPVRRSEVIGVYRPLWTEAPVPN